MHIIYIFFKLSSSKEMDRYDNGSLHCSLTFCGNYYFRISFIHGVIPLVPKPWLLNFGYRPYFSSKSLPGLQKAPRVFTDFSNLENHKNFSIGFISTGKD